MVRGVLCISLVAAAAAVVPASAAPAPAPNVVYEISRARPGGPAEVPVRIELKGAEGFLVLANLRPGDEAYDVSGLAIFQYGTNGPQLRTYGLPPAVPECPTPPACTAPAGGSGIGVRATFAETKGHRILVAGPATMKVTLYSHWWQARRTSLGLRTVTADRADASGVITPATKVEHFRSATAAAGKHGSFAFAQVPCDGPGAGTWTLSSDGSEPKAVTPNVCGPVFLDSSFAETADGRKWTVAGNVVGAYSFGLRLLVLDYPKR